MKFFLKPWLINSITLAILNQTPIGFKIYNDFMGIISAGLYLTLINFFIKPLLKIILLPFNLLTLGLFSWLVNVLSFGILFFILGNVSINPFYFPGVKYGDIAIMPLTIPRLGSLIIVTIMLSIIKKLIEFIIAE